MYGLAKQGSLVKIIFAAAVLFYIAMTFPMLKHSPVTMDEVLFAEPAKNFIEDGHFGTTSMHGLFQFETRTYWQHPLYMALMYIPIKAFGFNNWSIKVMSAVIGLVALLLARKIGRLFGVPNLFPILLVFNILFIFMARIGRMEMLALVLSMASFYFAWVKRPIAAGLLGSLALLNHPLGLFTVLNSVVILRDKGSLSKHFFIALSFPVAAAFSFVLVDFNEFVRQYFTVQHYLYDNSGWLGGTLTQVRNFIELLKGAREWLFWLLPLFLLFILGLRHPQDNVGKLLILIQVVNFLGLILIVPNKYINYYSALVLPYTALYVAYSIKKYRSIPVVIILAILLVTNGVGIIKHCYSNFNSTNECERIQALTEPYSVVLAQPNLGAYLVDQYVVGFHNVRMIMDLEKKSAQEALEEINPDYIIIDNTIASFEAWPLFTDSQDALGEFIKEHTQFCGQVRIHNQICYVFKVNKN